MSIKTNQNKEHAPLFGAEATVETEYIDNLQEYTKIGLNQLKPGDMVTGTPVVHLFVNEDLDKHGKPKNYDSIRVRVIDYDAGEYVDCYCNFPKSGQNIRKTSNFFRVCFDFIHSVMCTIDDTNATNANGDPVNTYKKINIEDLIEYLNGKEEITIKIIEGNDEYNSFLVTNWK